MKPARLRPAAKEDLGHQAVHYATVAGAGLADEFVDAALAALETIRQQPGIGSPSWNPPGQSPELRAWRLGRFPAVWFYFDLPDHIEVVRLLGEREDIAAILGAASD